MKLKLNTMYVPDCDEDFIYLSHGDDAEPQPFKQHFFTLEYLGELDKLREEYKILCEYGICDFVVLTENPGEYTYTEV